LETEKLEKIDMQEVEYKPTPKEIEKKPEKKEKRWLSIKEVSRLTDYSEVRLRHLCKKGKLPFTKLFRETGKRGGPWKYLVRAVDVAKYKKNLASFKEMGAWKPKKGKRKRGRPEKK
jgi:hypothetical protein